MAGRSVRVFLAVLVLASCTSGGSNGGTLLTEARPATTMPAVTASTTVPDATSTSSTTTSPTTTSSTTTTVVEVAGGADDGGTLVQLPVTGPEPGIAVAALLALAVGVWLLHWSWRERAVLVRAVLHRRAPIGDWPPNAVDARTVNDRRFRRAARREARRLGIDFVDGVDAFATRWAEAHESIDDLEPVGLGWLADWKRAMTVAARRIYG